MSGGALVVVPTYNEAENLEGLARRLLALPLGLDVLVVDDGSPDGTGELAARLSRTTGGRVRVLQRTEKLGLGSAYLAGFSRGLDEGYSRLVQMDADFSHDPRYVPALLALTERADLAVGSRYVPGGGTENWGVLRRTVSRGGSLYARWILGVPVRDVTGGFKAWRRETLEKLGLDKVRSNGYCFQAEMTWRAHRAGARIAELPIVFTDRRVGRSKMSRAIFLEALWRVPWLRLGGCS